MSYRTIAISLLVASGVFTSAMAASSGKDRLRQQAETLCADDGLRLCGDFAGDEARTSECMKANQAQLSPSCRKAAKALNSR